MQEEGGTKSLKKYEEKKLDNIRDVAGLTLNSGLNTGTAAVAFAITALWLIYFKPDRCYEGVVILSDEKFPFRELEGI